MHHYQHLHPSRQRQGRHGKESRELHDGRDCGCWKGATRPTTMGRLFLNQTLRGRIGEHGRTAPYTPLNSTAKRLRAYSN